MMDKAAAQHAYAAMQRAKGCPPMSVLKTLVPLVHAAAFEPAGCQRVALVLAQMHDVGGGIVQATMGHIANRAGLSKAQARKHVHALITEGVLKVIGNAHGGAPGQSPDYVFNIRLLEQLAASTPVLFGEQGEEPGHEAHDVYRFQVSAGGAQFLACLVGDPGFRRVVFWRVDGQRESYGEVALKVLLCDLSARGGWHCHLMPNGDPDVPHEQMFDLTLEEVAQLATWAQNAALGRVESLATA